MKVWKSTWCIFEAKGVASVVDFNKLQHTSFSRLQLKQKRYPSKSPEQPAVLIEIWNFSPGENLVCWSGLFSVLFEIEVACYCIFCFSPSLHINALSLPHSACFALEIDREPIQTRSRPMGAFVLWYFKPHSALYGLRRHFILSTLTCSFNGWFDSWSVCIFNEVTGTWQNCIIDSFTLSDTLIEENMEDKTPCARRGIGQDY